MKKIILPVMLWTITTVLFAQQKTKPGFGIRAGLNLASQSAKADGEKDVSGIKPGLVAGVFVAIPAGKSFAIQPELLFSQLGSTDNDEEFDYKFSTTFNYLALPVLFKYVFKNGSLYAGPQAAFLLSAKAKVEFDGESEEGDIDDAFTDVDLSGVIGADFNLSKTLLLGARYQHGFSNLLKDPDEDSWYRNNDIQISLAYTFPVVKKK